MIKQKYGMGEVETAEDGWGEPLIQWQRETDTLWLRDVVGR